MYPDKGAQNVIQPQCSKCPALIKSRTNISWGVGHEEADIFIIGEAPGAGDPTADQWNGGNYTGMAYTTRHAGRRIRSLFAAMGFDSSQLYFTNSVKCFPAAGVFSDTDEMPASPTNRPPTTSERTNCAQHLCSELAHIEPDCIVPTGRHATESILDLASAEVDIDRFTEYVFEEISIPKYPPIIPILHPSYQNVWIRRLGFNETSYRETLKRRLKAVNIKITTGE